MKQARDRKSTAEVKQVVLAACTYSKSVSTKNLDKICDAIGFPKQGFYSRIITRDVNTYTYRPVEGSKCITKWGALQRQCVSDFCHSDNFHRLTLTHARLLL